MILTCPACDTKYVVKDDAIPPQGRQVRCASCKHSWHQDPELILAEPAGDAIIDFGGPPPPQPEAAEEPAVESPSAAQSDDEIAGEPQPEPDEESPWGAVSPEPPESTVPLTGSAVPDEVAMEEAPAVADEWRAPVAAETAQPAEEEFASYTPIVEEEQSSRRWPVILLILVLIAAAAAAFWFLAPPEWKERAGIAQAGATPLQLMITTSDRQPLQSGNELVAISGRVINPTDSEQNVPPIRAELRDKETRQVVHSWTIAPPARVLAPRSSASFNSAEVDVPKGGDELTVTLGSAG
ncbi:MAG: zinc-ribbon domain-containing protein [Pseudomonadota bacterium]|nr:zinc-ribbon domain-containing protein [Pseudomonadota bacterium]